MRTPPKIKFEKLLIAHGAIDTSYENLRRGVIPVYFDDHKMAINLLVAIDKRVGFNTTLIGYVQRGDEYIKTKDGYFEINSVDEKLFARTSLKAHLRDPSSDYDCSEWLARFDEQKARIKLEKELLADIKDPQTTKPRRTL